MTTTMFVHTYIHTYIPTYIHILYLVILNEDKDVRGRAMYVDESFDIMGTALPLEAALTG